MQRQMWSPAEDSSAAFSDPWANDNDRQQQESRTGTTNAWRENDLFAAPSATGVVLQKAFGTPPARNTAAAATDDNKMRAALISPDAAAEHDGGGYDDHDDDNGSDEYQQAQTQTQSQAHHLKYRPRAAAQQHTNAKHASASASASVNDTATAPTAPISPMTRSHRSRSTRSAGRGATSSRGHEHDNLIDEEDEHDIDDDDEHDIDDSGGGLTFAAAHPQTPRSAQSLSAPQHMSQPDGHASLARSPASPQHSAPSPHRGGGPLQDASSFDSDLVATSPADALALSRLGPERTILKLRRQLDQYQGTTSSAKSALAKSDAVILELRRSVRELRGELNRAEGQRDEATREARERGSREEEARREMARQKAAVGGRERQLLELQAQLAGADGSDQLVGELQLKLDRAHAQILTSDMRLREREDEYSTKLRELESRMSDALRKRDLELDQLRGECDDLTSQIGRRDDDATELEARCRDAEEQFQEAVEELELAQREIDEAHEQLERREDEGDAEADALEGRVTELQLELNNARMTVGDRDEEIRRLKDARPATKVDLDDTAADSTVNLSALADQALLQTLQTQVAEKNSEIASLRRRLDLAQDSLDSHAQSGLEEVSPTKARHELEKELEDTAVKYGTAEMELADASLKLQESEGRVMELRAELDGVVSKMGDGTSSGAKARSRDADDAATKEPLDKVVAERDAMEKERDAFRDELEEITRECLQQLQANHEHINTVLSGANVKEAAAALESAAVAEEAAATAIARGHAEGQAHEEGGHEEEKKDARDLCASPLHVHFERNSPKTSDAQRKQPPTPVGNDDSFTRASDYRYLADELRDQLEIAKDEIHKLRKQLKLLEESSARRRIEREERLHRSPEDVYDEVVQMRIRLAEFEASRDQIEAKERALKDVYDKQRTVDAKTRGLGEVYRAQKELESKVSSLKKQNAELDRDRLAAIAEKDELQDGMEKLANDAEGLADHVEELERERDELAEKEDALDETARKLRGQIELLESEQHESEKGANDFEKEKASLAAENAELTAAKQELEAKLSKLNQRIESLEGDKSELQQNLEDAMAELELADEEVHEAQARAQAATSSSADDDARAELEQQAAELETKAADLRKELESRDSEIVRLRARLMEKDDNRFDTAARKAPSRSASKSPARQRIQERREASESKLRQQLGHVATWLDDRDGGGGGKVRERGGGAGAGATARGLQDNAAAPSSKIDKTGDAKGEVIMSTHVHLEELKRKLFTAEETLEETRKELEVVQTRPTGTSQKTHQRISQLEQSVSRLEQTLNEEKSRASRLERDLAAARSDAKKKEETCADLRQSLKEAVALLKPLKEHVAKSEGEIQGLRDELEEERSRRQQLEQKPAPSADSAANRSAGANDAGDTLFHERIEELEAELSDAAQTLQEREKIASELSDEADRLDDELQETHAELVDVREQLAAAAAANAIAASAKVVQQQQATKQSSSEEGDAAVKLREARTDLETARNDLREAESVAERFKASLEEAREKLDDLSDRHADVSEERDETKRQLKEMKLDLAELEEILSDKDDALQEASERLDAALGDGERAAELEAEADALRRKVHEQEAELNQQDEEVAKLDEELRQTQECIAGITDGGVAANTISPSDLSESAAAWKASNDERIRRVDSLRSDVQESNSRIAELENELTSTRRDVRKKEKSEKVLNRSLKEAVGLLKPLQRHVETAEGEKAELRRKLVTAQKRAEAAENTSSLRSSAGAVSAVMAGGDTVDRSVLEQLEDEKAELEKRIVELEQDRAKALADLVSSDDESARRGARSVRSEGQTRLGDDDSARLKARLNEMSSRYDVTKTMLDDAAETNASLLEDLKQMEREEEEIVEESEALRLRLKTMEEELENAKYIATSALVKVEEMSSVHGGGSSVGGGNGSDHAASSVSRQSGLAGIAAEDKFRSSVQSLEDEVRIAREKNAALERAIREKDELLSRARTTDGGSVGGGSSTGGTVSLEGSNGASQSRQSNGRAYGGTFRQGPRYIG